ncbi:MAG: class III lanthionine synthetase LanKC [Actinomycetota bacterium]|nr:class III lanthionine synthetase LanKC [Actinomycetota bacterium]
MDRGYEGFCLTDPLFYDSPTVSRWDDVDFKVADLTVPDGWRRTELEDWLVYAPEQASLPTQGWKIHVSATLDNAAEILDVIWDYCIPRGIAFKFVRSRQLLLLANGKYAHRGSSGKFVTIFPADDAEFEAVATELDAALGGQPGPYILSDLRWGQGPLYVRYGGFTERYCIGGHGELEPAIEDPDGDLVPDRRGATFYTPPWVSVPDCLAPHLAARTSQTVEDIPYRIERPLHFSNGGGVYAGVDRETGQAVVLKEARPHAGLAVDGADAVTRLRRERDMLARLAGLDIAPEVLDYLTVGGHEFLVLEFVEGPPLSNTLVDRYPLALLGDDVKYDEYTTWALDMHGRVEAAVARAHERGVVIGDLHPYNILVRPDGRIALIDLEIASDVKEGKRPTLGDPAFMSPRECIGFDIDYYALACLRFFLFMPITELLSLDPSKGEEFASVIAAHFPVPMDFLRVAVDVINAGPTPRAVISLRRPQLDVDPASWAAVRASMTAGILASATPERDDRLFPGDINQFETGGLNLAHGAAGVLYALAVTGAGRFPEHEQWLISRATNPQPGTRFGLYDGLHGVAYALDALDRRDDALRVLQICVDELGDNWDQLGLDLHGGLAGIGLNLAHFAEVTGESSLWDLVAAVTEYVAEELGDVESVPTTSGKKNPYAGLLRGSSGPALLFLRLFDRVGDPALLDLAATALRQDLRRCVVRDDGALEVNEVFRTTPYLLNGSVGIGLVLDRYLTRRHDEEFAIASRGTDVAARSEFYIQPGLFSGRAGMILHLCRKHAPGTAGADPLIAGHVRRLEWHAVDYAGHLAFPGEQLLRLSMDLGTGTAGVLLALGAALHDRPVHLPFLGPASADRSLVTGGR